MMTPVTKASVPIVRDVGAAGPRAGKMLLAALLIGFVAFGASLLVRARARSAAQSALEDASALAMSDAATDDAMTGAATGDASASSSAADALDADIGDAGPSDADPDAEYEDDDGGDEEDEEEVVEAGKPTASPSRTWHPQKPRPPQKKPTRRHKKRR